LPTMSIAKRRWTLAVLMASAIFLAVVAYNLIAVRGTFFPSRPASDAPGSLVLVGPGGRRIAGRFFLDSAASPSAPLVVVLHGDAPFVNPGYQYAFASNLARAVPGTRVAALLRPGYADPYGDKSDGDRGFAMGENYTHGVISQLATAIELLKAEWSSPSVVLVGHSGGATLSADISALYPGLIQHAFLVSCPCDVPAFRRHMARLQRDPFWLIPVRSVSPMQVLAQMHETTAVTAISGSDDPVALPKYAKAYIAGAEESGIPATMIVLPGKGHEILNDPAVVDIVAQALHAFSG
jgi:predicted esterase